MGHIQPKVTAEQQENVPRRRASAPVETHPMQSAISKWSFKVKRKNEEDTGNGPEPTAKWCKNWREKFANRTISRVDSYIEHKKMKGEDLGGGREKSKLVARNDQKPGDTMAVFMTHRLNLAIQHFTKFLATRRAITLRNIDWVCHT